MTLKIGAVGVLASVHINGYMTRVGKNKLVGAQEVSSMVFKQTYITK